MTKVPIINETLEDFIKKEFPIGSEWLLPNSDITIKILRYERRDATPSWYVNGPFCFQYPCHDLSLFVSTEKASIVCQTNESFNPDFQGETKRCC